MSVVDRWPTRGSSPRFDFACNPARRFILRANETENFRNARLNRSTNDRTKLKRRLLENEEKERNLRIIQSLQSPEIESKPMREHV